MTILIMKCPVCGTIKEVKEGEYTSDMYPMCDKCGMPMEAKRVERKKREKRRIGNDS